jgi:large subunit ribosomal protein L20
LLFGEPPSLRSKLTAAPGAAAESAAGRGALIVANDKRTKKGFYGRFRKWDMYLKYSMAKPYADRACNLYRQAKTRVIRAFRDRWISRRLFKRDRKRLWILRVNNNCRLHGVRYTYFMMRKNEAQIAVNRKIMSQLGIYDPGVFTNIMNVAIPEWEAIKEKRFKKPEEWTVEKLDVVSIPMIEKSVPELYTDEHIRFNRKVHDYGVEYTVQMGDPEGWREMLPQMPELANFNIPDHWLSNTNAEQEGLPLYLMPVPEHLENDEYLKFKKMVEQTWADEEEKAERGEPTWPKKEGVTREDWFKEEPQTWY